MRIMDAKDRLNNVLKSVFMIMPQMLNEKQKRILSGCIAQGYGFGGIKVVSELSGLDVKTIRAGIHEINGNGEETSGPQRVRRCGAGRPGIEKKYPGITKYVQEIIECNTYGDPEKIILWTNLSLRDIAEELEKRFGVKTNKNVVADILEELGYSRQVNQKMEQVGSQHKDRDSQFVYINDKAKKFLGENIPVISVDTKKKELLGNFKNNGAEYRPVKTPRRVLDHDFPIDGGKIAPYGVYLINQNTGFVNLGRDHDTSAFAVESIRRWWNIVGKNTFPDSKKIYINCDGGGSNGWSVRLWKYELALLAEETGLEIHVSHFPPGTSKWNKVEHRLFCFITKNWQGKPLIDINTTVNLISSTKTETGLEVKCVVDNQTYETGLKVSDKEFETIDIEKDDINPSWNYIIKGFKKGN